MIRVEINNSTCKLTGNPKALARLQKYLSFPHPNAYWIKKKMAYSWDGIIYPLSNKGMMKTGLLEYAIDYLSEYETEYEVIDHRNVLEVGEVPYKVGGLELTGKFAYQREAIKAVVRNTLLGEPHPRGIIAAAVNAGKTAIMMGIHMTYQNSNTIILLNSKVLYGQIKGDLAKAFPNTYGYMQGKNIKWGRIMVVMVQTLRNRLGEYREKLLEFNILLTDECDLAGNTTFETVYKNLSHISIRAGFAGSIFLRNLKKDQLRNTKMREIFGDSLFEISSVELEALDVSTKTVVKIVYGNTKVYTDIGFKEEFDACVTFNEDRHKIIFDRIMYNLRVKRKHIMVFCKYIEQVEELYDYLAERIPEKVTMAYTHHKRSMPSLIDGFREGDISLLITSLYLKRGMNFPLTDVIINASGGAFYSNPLQILGRGVRKAKGKRKFYMEDIWDAGKYLGNHSRKRIGYYKKQGYTPRIV